MKTINLNRYAVLLFLVCGAVGASAQGIIYQTLNAKLVDKQSTQVDVLVPLVEEMSQSKYASSLEPSLLSNAKFFNPNFNGIKGLKSNDLDLITISLDLPGIGLKEIGLYRKSIFTEDLIINSDQGILSNKDAKKILFYRGIVLDYPSSLVSITISGNEISGMISIGNNNFNLGKIKGIPTHILYHEQDLDLAHDFVCSTAEEEIGDAKPVGDFNPDKTTQCVRIRVEVDNGLGIQLGGTAASVNYVASLYNEVITLYNNDNISVNVSEVYVWQTTSPYSGDASNILNQMNNTSSNSDLTTLLSTQGSGGIAWVGGLCSTSNATNFNSINGFHSNVPTYSWDVEVVAHEMGHNLNSPHTHACAWNGNNTAIDGCGANAGFSEGCTGSNPAGGGTIMSYCHLTSVGINFTLGFGPQPSQRIRDYVDGSNCLGTVCVPVDATCDDGILNGTEIEVDCGGAACPACPTCDDGIQNGMEEGVDCGGNLCVPCNCFDETVLLTIVFDNYPEETSWNIENAGGAVVASGGTYPSEPDGSTYTVPLCLPAACYTLKFMDTVGDGICCGFGNGSYELTDNSGTVLVSGGEFLTEESTGFCLTTSTASVDLNLKTYLQGPYNDVNELMHDNLRSGGWIPLNEPYSELGYPVQDVSTNIVQLGITGSDAIVDWILVELRDQSTPGTALASASGLLQRDGDIVAADGSTFSIDVPPGSNVYVALRHRNHFGVRSNTFYSTNALITVDFTDILLQTFGTNAMVNIGGNNAMISGDANSDGQINSIDKNLYWRIHNSQNFDYLIFGSDFNMDGTVNSVDKNIHWRINNSKTEQLD